MTLSDSQKKALKRALRHTMREWRSQQAAAEKWGNPAPSIYDVRILELTPKKAQIFLRHGLIEYRGNDPRHDRMVATSAFGRSYRSESVLGEPRFFWTREGLVTVKRLLEAEKPGEKPRSMNRGNPMFLHGAERQKARKALKKRLGITGEMPSTGGEIDALPIGTFLLRHGEGLRDFVPAEKPMGYLRVDNREKGWIVGVLGTGGGFSGPAHPSGILEVVPLTPTLLASMADVAPRHAWIPLPRSAGYGKADRQAWAYWLGAEILEAGSEARRALKDAIETMAGSEVKIGDITWEPGQNVHVEFEKPGEKSRSMGFLKNGNNTVSYKIEVKKNGQRYGEFGPYKRKADADTDAKALRQKGSGVRVSVVRSNPGHQWIQEVQEEIAEDGTAGRFTAQARRAGYKDTMAFAKKVMHEWRAGRERVWNKREKRWQKVTTMTMRRANYLLNTRQRRNG